MQNVPLWARKIKEVKATDPSSPFTLLLCQTQDTESSSAQDISNMTLLIKAWSVDIDIQSFDFARPFKAEMRGDQACVASPVSCSASHQLTVQDTSETAKGAVPLQASNPQLAAAMPQTKVLEVQANFKIKLTGLLGSLICSQTLLNKITFLCP